MERTPLKTLEQLDSALFHFQESMGKMAIMLNQSINAVDPSEPYFLDIIRGCESLSKTIGKTVEIAPYIAFRNDFEAVEAIKAWLTESTEYIGEQRGNMITMLMKYQEALIAKTETKVKSQMVLI
jgi:hypothetical protein